VTPARMRGKKQLVMTRRVDEEVHDEVNYAKKETKELLVHDAGTDEKMDKKETQELQTISVGEIKPTQKVPMSIDFQLGATGDKKETKKTAGAAAPTSL